MKCINYIMKGWKTEMYKIYIAQFNWKPIIHICITGTTSTGKEKKKIEVLADYYCKLTLNYT